MVDGGDDPLRLTERRRHGPPLDTVIADAQHPGVRRQVLVHLRYRIVKAEAIAQSPDVGRLARQERPARLRTVPGGIGLEHIGRVQLRLQRDRVQVNLPAQAIAQQPLNSAQMDGHGRADAFASDVHHVNHHDLAVDQVVIEADLVSILGIQRHVGEGRVGFLDWC
ncbi:hypothetical protein D9M69_541810 [compost metagenome]